MVIAGTPGDVLPPAREWIGIFAYHGDELRELDYPGYERQRYDGGEYFRFVFGQITGPTRLNAMGSSTSAPAIAKSRSSFT